MTGFELVKRWNEVKKTNFSKGTAECPSGLVNSIDACIKEFGEDMVTKYWTKKMLDDGCSSNMNELNNYRNYLEFKEKEYKDASETKESNVIKILGEQLVTLMGTELANKTEDIIKERLDKYVSDKIITKVVSVDGIEKTKLDEITHEKFETILKFVAMDEPVMLVGPAGTGKNVIASQVAKALGLDFYFSNAVTQEYKLTGFVDAMGNFQKTQFFDAFTKGGLFLLDEIDASVPEVLVILNCAIANRYFDFPKLGRVYAHENFRVISCANTFGTGANMEYVGRNQLDGASLNRFGMVYVDYDKRIEEMQAHGNKDIVDFCRAFRDITARNGAHCIVSYREIGRLSKMIDYAKMDVKTALETCLIKGLEKDTLRMVVQEMKDDVVYKKYLQEIVNN